MSKTVDVGKVLNANQTYISLFFFYGTSSKGWSLSLPLRGLSMKLAGIDWPQGADKDYTGCRPFPTPI